MDGATPNCTDKAISFLLVMRVRVDFLVICCSFFLHRTPAALNCESSPSWALFNPSFTNTFAGAFLRYTVCCVLFRGRVRNPEETSEDWNWVEGVGRRMEGKGGGGGGGERALLFSLLSSLFSLLSSLFSLLSSLFSLLSSLFSLLSSLFSLLSSLFSLLSSLFSLLSSLFSPSPTCPCRGERRSGYHTNSANF